MSAQGSSVDEKRGGPWWYAAELCQPTYPCATKIFSVLRLGHVYCPENNAQSSMGPHHYCSGEHAVRALDGHGSVPGWMAALVLASVVHRDPPAELLAAAAVLITEGKVVVVR